jgi:hypothetical protein
LAYPVANTVHVLGAALLFGAVLAIDLRWLGRLPEAPVRSVERVFTPVAVFGLVALVVSGTVLFAADARALVRSPIFFAKLGLIALAVGNFLLSRRLRPERGGVAVALAAGASLLFWAGVIVLGRWIAYA